MQRRSLGESGISVAPLALGTNVFGWTIDEKTSFGILDAFVAAGCNLIDTADVYSTWVPGNKGGESETIIGKWMSRDNNRGRVILATKVGKPMGENKKGLSAKYIRQAVEDSLKRLQTDYIDLYQAHEDDANTPLEETLSAFEDLVKAGKVRAIGASNYSGNRLAKSIEISNRINTNCYCTLQPQYNLYDRQAFETELLPVCKEKQVAVLPYYGLASGFLTGKYRSEADFSKSPRGQGIRRYLNPRGLQILAALDKVAVSLHSTPAAVALAWLMARPTIAAPIASATSVDQLKQSLAALDIELDRGAMELLNRASAE